MVLISVDGLNPDAITRLDARGGVPAFRRLLREGSSTLNARSAYEQTNTLPNHTGMLTGRRIEGPLGSSVTFNDDRPGTLATAHGRYVPGIFDTVHDAGGSTAFFAEKDKFNFLLRSWDSAHGAADRKGRDDGRGKIDVARIGPADTLVRETLSQLRGAARDRRGRPSLVFLHVAAPDLAGHADGFMSGPYLDAVRRADAEIGTVLDAITASSSLNQHTTVVVTADHGGSGPSHRDPTRLANYRIPFFLWGQRVQAGQDLYAINPGRRDPGKTRVGYDGPQPIRNLDAADLVLRLLGLPPLPETTRRGLEPLRSR
ncbi:MAG: type phosphodiesterase/nucleotide pyrophosphatase [Marmoricola sp.]|nr:type phosphodiesterase/nucleotide pyrophosphatase [Marmoricola sp.]